MQNESTKIQLGMATAPSMRFIKKVINSSLLKPKVWVAVDERGTREQNRTQTIFNKAASRIWMM